MKLGAEPKKVGIFAGLLVVAVIVYWINSSPEAPASPSAARPSADAVAAVAPSAGPALSDSGVAGKKRIASGKPNLSEIIYKLREVDNGKVDPTLRLDLLAKVQAVEPEGGGRNLFQYCVDCSVPQPTAAASNVKLPVVGPIHPNGDPHPPQPAQVSSTQAPVAQPAPAPPPINLKYYGYSTKRSDGEKKAFFLDGEDVIVASEGEIIKKQYKVVRIGVSSVQMEDTASKSTQTLQIQPEAASV